jgi:mannose-6-phosphate isomerase-like protein (cupin superfamily)
MSHPVRRFVTGLDGQNRSIVQIDDTASNILPIAGWPGAFITELWVTEESPVDNTGTRDRGARPIRHDPTPHGTIFRVVEIPPEMSGSAPIDVAAAFASMGSHNRPTEQDARRHGSMHFTNSVDYIVVIAGEMAMLMDDGEVLLRPGDCVVQRGTKHAWVNRGDVPCVIAAVLVDARPIYPTSI